MEIKFDNFNSLHADLQIKGMYDKQMLIICPIGSIDTYNSSDFRETVEKTTQATADVKHVVFNMDQVGYVSSTGIAVFTTLLNIFAKAKIEMHIWKVQEKVLDVFQLLGFTEFIHFIQELNEINEDFTKKTFEPIITPCPHCGKSVKILKIGKFKCGMCKGIIVVNDRMEITGE